MKLLRVILILFVMLLAVPKLDAAYEGEGEVEGEGEGPYGTGKEKTSGWFLGTDQGVLFFLGDSSDLMGTQYYLTTYGGYNIKGILQPMVRLGQAFGSANTFFNPSTYFFIFEGGARVTPIRTMVRPFLSGTAGLYILSFDDFDTIVQSDTNFTFSGGGGVEVAFGSSRLTIGGEYRGFQNSGFDLRGVEVTLGYFFQF